MQLISYYFFFFLALVCIGYHLLPWRYGKPFLLACCYVFYGAFYLVYSVLPFISTLIDYCCAKKIGATETQKSKKNWLYLSVIANLSLLAFFKYNGFFIENINLLFPNEVLKSNDFINIILPIGISFYTFQSMSYTIDVYRGKQQVEHSFTDFALYVVYFPQLIAGPIERAKDLLPQVKFKQSISVDDFRYGTFRIAVGLFKKLVISDRLALTADMVFLNPSAYSSPEMLLGVLCFSFQLYIDFSAYTDIAIGVSRLFGIKLSENFNYPFLATSPSDFWSRWHITLTRWFSDYVFKPMGGMKLTQKTQSLLRIIAMMTLVGLWHGPSWNYVLFGLLSGLSIAIHMSYKFLIKSKYISQRVAKPFSNSAVANALMIINILTIMIFFRAESIQAVSAVFNALFSLQFTLRPELYPSIFILGLTWLMHNYLGIKNINLYEIASRGRYFMASIVLFLSLVFFYVDTNEQFIYFQF